MEDSQSILVGGLDQKIMNRQKAETGFKIYKQPKGYKYLICKNEPRNERVINGNQSDMGLK